MQARIKAELYNVCENGARACGGGVFGGAAGCIVGSAVELATGGVTCGTIASTGGLVGCLIGARVGLFNSQQEGRVELHHNEPPLFAPPPSAQQMV